MALSKSDITLQRVGETLGESIVDVGGLCTSARINPWSRWKPVRDSSVTLTEEILSARNFGIHLVQESTPSALMADIDANGGSGFTYDRPFGGPGSPYRLGDFRGYDHLAEMPVQTTYRDGAQQDIGGVTGGNHAAYEVPLSGFETTGVGGERTYLTKDDIYRVHDAQGNPVNLHRGALVTDGTTSVWYSKMLYWWTPQMQQYADKEVRVYEFMTNAINTPSAPYVAHADDVFIALPHPVVTVQVKGSVIAGGQKANVHFYAVQRRDNNRYYDIELQFSSVGVKYEGGTLDGIVVKLCKDDKGVYPIAIAPGLPSNVTLGLEETTQLYKSTLYNNTDTRMCWLCLWYDGVMQQSIQAIEEMPQPVV